MLPDMSRRRYVIAAGQYNEGTIARVKAQFEDWAATEAERNRKLRGR